MAGNWKKTLGDLLYNGDLDGAYNLLDGILRDNSGDIKARIAFGKVQYELGDPAVSYTHLTLPTSDLV